MTDPLLTPWEAKINRWAWTLLIIAILGGPTLTITGAMFERNKKDKGNVGIQKAQ